MNRHIALAAAIVAGGLLTSVAQATPTSYTMTFSDLDHGTHANYSVIDANYQPTELAGSGITLTWDNAAVFYGSDWIDGTPGAWANNDHTTDTADGNNLFNTTPYSVTFSQPVYVWSAWVVPYASSADGGPAAWVTIDGYTNPTDVTPVVTVESSASPAHNYGVYVAPNPVQPTGDYNLWEKVTLGYVQVTKLTFSSGIYPQLDDMTISLLPPPLLGDTNEDYVVDISDYNNVINNFGGAGLGDTNNDGMVDVTDFNNVINNFGADPLNGGFGTPNVPEPASMGLLAIGALGLLRRRR